MRPGPVPVIDRLALAIVLGITVGVVVAGHAEVARADHVLAGTRACAGAACVALLAAARGRWLVAAACAAFVWGAVAVRLDARHLQSSCVDGRSEIVRGRVSGLPREQGPVRRFDFDVADVVPVAGCPGPGPRRLRLTWYEGRPIRVGEPWVLEVRLRALRNYRNPGGFDYVGWARDHGIDAAGTVRRGASDRSPPGGIRPMDVVDRMREAVARAIAAAPVREPGVLTALAVGDARRVDGATWELFRRTGTIHLLVISGLHIVIAAGFGLWIARAAARLVPTLLRRRGAGAVAVAGAIAVATGYSALAGFTLPVARAWLMSVLGVCWWVSGRRLPARRACAVALATLLIADPNAILDRSLWLSFGATAALVLYFAPRRGLPWTSGWLRAQGVMFAAMMPLLAVAVGQLAWVAPIANLIAVPLVSALVVPLLLLAIVLLPVADNLAASCLGWADWLCGVLLAVLRPLADAPVTFLATPDPMLIAFASTAALALLLPLRLRDRLWLVPVVALAFHRSPTAMNWAEARVTVLDVGQGLAVVVDTAGHRLLYDAGPAYPSGFDLGEAVVAPALRATGPGRLDLVVVSHGDIDHRGGADAVGRRLPVAARLSGGGVAGPACRRGHAWQWDGVAFVVLHPAGGQSSANDASCVLSVRAERGRALLPGDVTAAVEGRLARAPAEIRSDLLVASHHGSRSSSSAVFLAAVAPRVAVVSAGHRNRFGHPHPEVVARFAAAGVDLRPTTSGAWQWRTDAPGVLSAWDAAPGPTPAGAPPGNE